MIDDPRYAVVLSALTEAFTESFDTKDLTKLGELENGVGAEGRSKLVQVVLAALDAAT